jgi:HD-like signal output (HDOD) protein
MNPNRPTLDSLVNDATVVYSLPQLYEHLNLVINHPRSSISDITKVITEDGGLTSRILKLANSPLFGYHSKIDTITKAITVIGTQQLRDVALAISVIEVFSGIPEDMINMTSFWQHSITSGIVARILATYRRDSNVERFLVAGMLHDVGQLILCTRFPELICETVEISRETGKPHYTVQRSLLGYDHGDVGGQLLKQWRIPAIITEAVAFHHAPGLAELYPMETSLMHVADVISHAMQVGFGGEPFIPPLDKKSWELLAIPNSMLATIMNKADEQLAEVMVVLSGEICS